MKAKRAILADNAVDGPHPGDLIAPAGGPAGEGDDSTTDALQSFHRRVCDGGKTPICRQRVVDFGQHDSVRAPRLRLEILERQKK